MHSIVRTVKANALNKGIPSKAQPNVSTLLSPSKAIHFQHRTIFTPLSSATTLPKATTPLYNSIQRHSNKIVCNWTQRAFNSSQSSTASPAEGTSGTKSEIIQELENFLAKKDYEGFQKALLAVSPSKTDKDLYHFSLKVLVDHPLAFSAQQQQQQQQDITNRPSSLTSAISIITEMSREANMGNISLQPDNETLLLLLNVAKSSVPVEGSSEYAAWESVRILVDTIRHGRLPAILSTDQWELPELATPLDSDLWKAMFECLSSVAATVGSSAPKFKHEIQRELDTSIYLMADQLSKEQDFVLDDQLWGYVIQGFGNSGSANRLVAILPRLPSISDKNSNLYFTLAEALANCGLRYQAMDIMDSLSDSQDSLSSITPFVALARQHAKVGDYESIRRHSKVWTEKGSPSPANDTELVELHRSMLTANSVALDRMVDGISKVINDRHMSTLPLDVLPGMATPPQLTMPQFSEATYLWMRSQESMNSIPVNERTPEDYDLMVRISTRLNLLYFKHWKLEDNAVKLISEMKAQGLKPLQSTYYNLMETISRTREYGSSRASGDVADRVLKVFDKMIAEEGYTSTSAKDFRPLIDACFGIYSYSPFVAGQWMYSNQLYPVSMSSLEKVEALMKEALVSEEEKGRGISHFHDSTTLGSVLGGLAHGDEVEELLKRWESLPLEGIERDSKLYQTFIGAACGQEKLARYVLRTTRYDLLKEQPAIQMTPEIFSGLLNCCVRVQDSTAARALILQYSTSGDIRKTEEWYIPMVRTCLMVDGMETEGDFLLEEMRKSNMEMVGKSGSFCELLMEHHIMKQKNYQTGREIFKQFIKSEQNELEEILATRNKRKQGLQQSQYPFRHEFPHMDGDGNVQEDSSVVMVSDKELHRRIKRLQDPVRHWIERVEVSSKTASMLNLLALSFIRERQELLERERESGFGAGSKEGLRESQILMHYMAGETRRHPTMASASTHEGSSQSSSSSQSIPDTSSSSSASSTSPLLRGSAGTSASSPTEFSPTTRHTPGKLVYINKYVLGEYIDMCTKVGTPKSLEEAEWALNKIMPRVIGQARMAKDAQRLRQTFESSRDRKKIM
ncbi:hypothetical protein BGZ76_002654 [Entomortierella beljakovae]|nr:hypothetical protein BGZ76_002654 [Entomortierella beljakovae]